jgi:hypothetical protein
MACFAKPERRIYQARCFRAEILLPVFRPAPLPSQIVHPFPRTRTIGCHLPAPDEVMINARSRKIIAETATSAGIEPLALLAVAEVESGGKAFVRIGARLEPVIRFEAHYFDRRLSGAHKRRARRAGLASPVAGAIANPASQGGRWAMLERAMEIDRGAALESVSWGIGQVMGAHWAWLGYASVDALVAQVRSGLAGQAALMVCHIGKSGLTDALNSHDWMAFARVYNGPGYNRHAYPAKMARAYAKYRRLVNAKPGSAGTAGRRGSLAYGDRGDAVRDLQTMLGALGYPLVADGVYGARTRLAVRRFQSRQGLAVDGVAGPLTMARIRNGFRPAATWRAILRALTRWIRSLWP